MERDIEAKLDRLCARYLDAQARLELVRPVDYTTGKKIMRMRSEAVQILSGLQSVSRGPASSLVKLAFVRGMRSQQAEASLSDHHMEQINFLERRVHTELLNVEAQALRAFSDNLRRLRLVRTLRNYDYPRVTVESVSREPAPFTLECHARTSIRTILETAFEAGCKAATPHNEYDGVAHDDT